MPFRQCVSALTFVLATLWVTSVAAAIAQQAPQSSLPQPSLQQQPEDVVRIVIEALARNDEPYPDAGIATTFAFASPQNKVNTGPLPKFSQMVKNPVYGIMVNHVKHEFSEVVMRENQAYQMVRIVGRNGAEIVFAFGLSQQLDGEFEGMWMTDAVWPVARGDVPEQAF